MCASEERACWTFPPDHPDRLSGECCKSLLTRGVTRTLRGRSRARHKNARTGFPRQTRHHVDWLSVKCCKLVFTRGVTRTRGGGGEGGKWGARCLQKIMMASTWLKEKQLARVFEMWPNQSVNLGPSPRPSNRSCHQSIDATPHAPLASEAERRPGHGAYQAQTDRQTDKRRPSYETRPLYIYPYTACIYYITQYAFHRVARGSRQMALRASDSYRHVGLYYCYTRIFFY